MAEEFHRNNIPFVVFDPIDVWLGVGRRLTGRSAGDSGYRQAGTAGPASGAWGTSLGKAEGREVRPKFRSTYTYCISWRNLSGGMQLRWRRWENTATLWLP